ncbi:MAG: hypothetical protein V4598_18285 [Bdellovibrionota bacterium]
MIVLLFSLLFGQVYAATEVRIIDSCSGKSVGLTNPNGLKLQVNLTNIDPEDSLELTVTWRPAGIIEDLSHKDQLVWKYRYNKISPDGKLALRLPIPKASWLWQVEQKHQEYRIWDAEVTWLQERAQKTGSDIATFYHAPNVEPYFELTSPSQCEWEGEANISSKLYENLSTTWMNVVKEYTETWDRGSGPGMSIGYNNNTGGNLPVGSLSNNTYGWAFKDWTKQSNRQQIFRYERRFVLNRDEAGIYISRLSFTRHEVNRYEWVKPANGCGEFRKVSQGLLDVGMPTEDFMVIPKNFYPHPDVLKNYINIARPQINTCPTSVGQGAEVATDILPAGQKGILFYYQNDPNRSLP